MEKQSTFPIDEGALAPSSLRVVDLGKRAYKEVWDLQLELVEKRARGETTDTLVVVEHESVFTCGRRTAESNKPATPVPGVPIYEIERGGDITYHGPGQLVCYPIVHLTQRGFRIGDYIHALERALVETLSDFGILAHTREGREYTGVWVGPSDCPRKIASIGLGVRHWVAYHGLALNVSTDLSFFSHIRPCGFSPDKMTNMENELGRRVDGRAVKDVAVGRLVAALG
ncbi:MAG TPA: lipoyl(octanoyl) transferase LipB, partial [Burkholderiales bacterium]|nr:lipoyl(octanoyl) transferase LipB [Burkholderiales bacterium]